MDLMVSSPLFESEYQRERPDLGPRSWDGTQPPATDPGKAPATDDGS